MKNLELKLADRFSLPFSALLLTAAALMIPLCLSGPQPLAADPPPAAGHSRIYDTDPGHLWNRLHAALFVRTAADGSTWGEDELTPLLWPESKFLLAGEHHKLVLALLDEFLAKDGQKLIKDPLKRAMFQHDLWADFDWLANPTAPYGYRHDDVSREARALQVRLA